MTQHSGEQSTTQWSTGLLYASLAAWAVSLLLPAFSAPGYNGVLYDGKEVLFLGLMFGWMVGGYAAYANLFFFIVVLLFVSGRRPRATVVNMLVLAASLPLFAGPITSEGSSTATPVASWGWGAVLWVVAIVLLALASWTRNGKLGGKAVRRVLALLTLSVVGIAALHFHQRSLANEQERQFYLGSGLAFTLEQPCGIALTKVDRPLLPPGALVAIDIDPAVAGDPDFSALTLPTLDNYSERGVGWITYSNEYATPVVRMRTAPRPDGPVIQVRRTGQGAVVRLRGSPDGPVLYEQPLKKNVTLDGRRQFCPMSTRSGFSGLTVGYDRELLRAIGQVSPTAQRARLADELAREPWSLGAADEDGIKGLRTWDGRQVILEPESIRSRVGFCSPSYIVLTYVSHNKGALRHELSPVGEVYDRKSLRPLAVFNDGRSCAGGRCPEADRATVTGVRITDQELIFETASGDLSATR